MITRYKINEVSKLRNGCIAISGAILDGPSVVVGQEGTAITSELRIKVEVVGIGIINPNLIPPSRQDILVTLKEGDETLLNGLILNFVIKSGA